MKQLFLWFLQLVLSDVFVIMCGMFLFVGLLELVVPARKTQKRNYRVNIGCAFVNVVVVAAMTPAISAVTALSIRSFGSGFIDLRTLGFDGAANGLFAIIIGTLILDFFQYWRHRLEHSSKFLWQQHLLHHSDEHMNVTTAARQHPFEFVITAVLVTIPTAILFQLPAADIGIMSLVPFAWQYVTHANIRLGFGPFWWLVASPNYHRVHHSLEPLHINKNFVGWFPIWDIVFGTALVPRGSECPATGVAGVSVQTLLQAYLLPFVGWGQMIPANLFANRKEAVRPTTTSRAS